MFDFIRIKMNWRHILMLEFSLKYILDLVQEWNTDVHWLISFAFCYLILSHKNAHNFHSNYPINKILLCHTQETQYKIFTRYYRKFSHNFLAAKISTTQKFLHIQYIWLLHCASEMGEVFSTFCTLHGSILALGSTPHGSTFAELWIF